MATPVPPPGGAPVAVRPCPVCAAPVAADALFCPACGTTLQRRRGPDTALVAAGVLAIVVGVLIALLVTRDDSGTVSGAKTTTPTTVSVSTGAATTSIPAATTTVPAPAPAPTTAAPATTAPPTATKTAPATTTTAPTAPTTTTAP